MAAENQQQSVKAGSSRFTVTCGMLRQYMNEQGGHGAVRLAPAMAMSHMPGTDVAGGARSATEAVPAQEKGKIALDLFPQQPGTLKASQKRKEPEKAPLTIFYGGRVFVFDDFPAEKAEKLIKAARSCSAASPAARQRPRLPDMPVARKESLQRFLEKRKNRLATAEDPDPAGGK